MGAGMSDEQLNEVLGDDKKLDQTVRRAVEEAIRQHREQKNKVAGWDGEKVIIVDPNEAPDHPK
jgi:hypothetical protein